jgi:uroporphyrinogen decarboxylase
MNVTVSTAEFEPYLGEPDAGNTLAYGGDPAKGVVEEVGPMRPEDHIELCRIIGQDVMIIGTAIWPPFRKEDEDGNLTTIADKSIKNLSDFRKLKKPDQKDINTAIEHLRSYREAVKGTNIGVTVQIGGIFIYCYEFLVGMNDFMMACYEDRQFVEEILDAATDWCVSLSKAVIKEGIDYSYFFEDGGFKTGLFLPPKLMKEIWVPRMARIVETALEARNAVFFHSCGNITDIVPDLIDMGIDCINPMDPSGIDYRDWKKRFGDRACLAGNIDVEWPLVNGTPEDIEKDIIKHMDVMKPGNGYIAASSHSIVNYVPYENFVTMINAIHKYGKY